MTHSVDINPFMQYALVNGKGNLTPTESTPLNRMSKMSQLISARSTAVRNLCWSVVH